MTEVAVIGGGIGGLTTAALLTRAGCDVVVLEAHVYPGGSAGTFFIAAIVSTPGPRWSAVLIPAARMSASAPAWPDVAGDGR